MRRARGLFVAPYGKAQSGDAHFSAVSPTSHKTEAGYLVSDVV